MMWRIVKVELFHRLDRVAFTAFDFIVLFILLYMSNYPSTLAENLIKDKPVLLFFSLILILLGYIVILSPWFYWITDQRRDRIHAALPLKASQIAQSTIIIYFIVILAILISLIVLTYVLVGFFNLDMLLQLMIAAMFVTGLVCIFWIDDAVQSVYYGREKAKIYTRILLAGYVVMINTISFLLIYFLKRDTFAIFENIKVTHLMMIISVSSAILLLSIVYILGLKRRSYLVE